MMLNVLSLFPLEFNTERGINIYWTAYQLTFSTENPIYSLNENPLSAINTRTELLTKTLYSLYYLF